MTERATMTRDELADRLAAAGRALLVPDPEVEVEYNRLFLNPLGAPCPPWQSVYEPSEGDIPQMLGLAHHSALDWYRQYGVEPASDSEPADHAGLLLLFYAKLLMEEAEDQTLALFRSQHLSWLSAFFLQVETESRIAFFRDLGLELREFLEMEHGGHC